MLHDPARHEPLRSLPWDADRAREAIDHIVRGAERRFESGGWWPMHARDAEGNDKAGEPNYTLYFGAAGVVFGARSNWLLALLATALVAVLFQPLRTRFQRGVNRLLYGQRDEPFAVLAELGRRLEQTVTPEAVRA